ncbi:MAG TPA: DUF1553 domain-containing protein, partial [Desulfuromonadaceae bacterium]|nr:DUF1553 domain-containing protein [Desulfuromonadaceae bacterium]
MPFESDVVPAFTNRIDQLVSVRWPERQVTPAKLCSDAVFVRRVYLDVIGTLPTAAEAQEFISDRRSDKRAVLIDGLLARDEFADYWAMKWSDLLRVKAEFPINLWPNAAQGYHHWLREAIRSNESYDRFARDQLLASGSNFENAPVNFYRAMQNKTPAGIAQVVALTFMGARADRWPSNRLADLSVFFANVGYKSTSEWKEEIVYFNPASTNAGALNGTARTATFPDGTRVTLRPDEDPRVVLAGWLTSPRNPWFARSMANRMWSWLLGRGIVEEPDDLRPDNPPSNPELLAYLERELVASGYDLKHLFRLILNSDIYQLSSGPMAGADFAAYPLRRLDAEVLIDAIDQVTGGTESYSSAIPEPYTYIPDNLRSVALPDGSITSPFLELFGRSPRDTGYENERNNRISAAQKLWLLNSSQMQRKLEKSRLVETVANKKAARTVTELYLAILSRYPTEEESRMAAAYLN